MVDTSSALNEQLADAARALQAETSTQRTLERCVALATSLIEGCDYAGISFVRRKAPIETPAATDPLVLRGDELQYSLQEGPCLDAIWEHETVHSPNLATEQRWPHWAPKVVEELGVASMLSFQLYTSQDTLGALNMYSKRVDAFDEDDFNAGMVLAAQGAVALAESQATEQWQNAALNRTIIGQAEGILMERLALTADQAFAVLRRVSQQNNAKLYQVAGELVLTREIPGAAMRDSATSPLVSASAGSTISSQLG
jgi:transcriptional regulator with GAF, ATPase, and Fis domain